MGDTGVSYLRIPGKEQNAKGNDNWDREVKPDECAPRVVGLSKSLGGGACVHFKQVGSDQEHEKPSTALALKIDL